MDESIIAPVVKCHFWLRSISGQPKRAGHMSIETSECYTSHWPMLVLRPHVKDGKIYPGPARVATFEADCIAEGNREPDETVKIPLTPLLTMKI